MRLVTFEEICYTIENFFHRYDELTKRLENFTKDKQGYSYDIKVFIGEDKYIITAICKRE